MELNLSYTVEESIWRLEEIAMLEYIYPGIPALQLWKAITFTIAMKINLWGNPSILVISLLFQKLKKINFTWYIVDSQCCVCFRCIAKWFSYTYPYAAAKSLQSCPTLCDPIDGSPPGSRVPGILQARTLEWVAISFSNAWKWKVKVKSLSRVRLFATPWTAAYQAPSSMGFSRQE